MPLNYSKEFYEEMKDTSLSSAREIVPKVLEYVPAVSVIDIGCGMGVWLSVFKEKGVEKIHGFDGNWVKQDELKIPKECFTSVDLESNITFPFKADLAVCLEVAEHISQKNAHIVVENLVHAAPVVFFSAAMPFQGGSRHINEQWPEFWAKLFSEKGYVPVDCLRMKVWNNPNVSFFYKQNIFIFVDKNTMNKYPKLQEEIEKGNGEVRSIVHPYMYLYYAERWKMLVPFLGKFPPRFLHFVKRILQLGRKKK